MPTFPLTVIQPWSEFSAILEVAEPSLIIAISDFPLEQVSTPMMTLAQVQEAFAQGTSYEIAIIKLGSATSKIAETRSKAE